jgi:hypothetical protein
MDRVVLFINQAKVADFIGAIGRVCSTVRLGKGGDFHHPECFRD